MTLLSFVVHFLRLLLPTATILTGSLHVCTALSSPSNINITLNLFAGPCLKPTISVNINKNLYTIHEPKVMGILNVTVDSFYDGGQYGTIDSALLQVEKMLNDGAHFIDVGGQSTRPGADEIAEALEIKNTSEIIQAINKRFPEAIISIDTYRQAVAKMAVESGATIIKEIFINQKIHQHKKLMKLVVSWILLKNQF